MRKATNRIKIYSLLIVFSVVFCFSVNAFGGGGGPEDPACQSLPDPDSGKFLKGEFTVARDKGSCSIGWPEDCAHYNVHVLLKSAGQKHLFSFSTVHGLGDMCFYNSDTLKEVFELVPCSIGVEEAFGFLGTPVIYSLKIELQDFCDTPEEMIAGNIVIRVVP